MRTIINFYDRDVTNELVSETWRSPHLLESIYVASDEAGGRLARAIEKLPKADRCRFLVERVEVMVEKINMMSKQPYLEEEDRPGYLSPSSEAYWSM